MDANPVIQDVDNIVVIFDQGHSFRTPYPRAAGYIYILAGHICFTSTCQKNENKLKTWKKIISVQTIFFDNTQTMPLDYCSPEKTSSKLMFVVLTNISCQVGNIIVEI